MCTGCQREILHYITVSLLPLKMLVDIEEAGGKMPAGHSNPAVAQASQ